MLTEERFRYQLAERLHMTVGELMTRMSHREYIGWQALSAVESREREHQRKVQSRKRGRGG